MQESLAVVTQFSGLRVTFDIFKIKAVFFMASLQERGNQKRNSLALGKTLREQPHKEAAAWARRFSGMWG